MSKTQVIVLPGRCVRHEGRRRTEGALLMVGRDDLAAWTASGDVRVYIGTDLSDAQSATAPGGAEEPALPTVHPEIVRLTVDAMAVAAAEADRGGAPGGDKADGQTQGGQPGSDAEPATTSATSQAQAPEATPSSSDAKSKGKGRTSGSKS